MDAAGPMDAAAQGRRCYRGHPVGQHDVFCGACGAQIDPTAQASRYDFEAEGLTVVRGGRTILDRATFVVPPHSLVAVIGPSGAGKTTLLGALTGTAPPIPARSATRGTICTRTTTACAT